jgi:hypothetical protein
MPVAGRGTAFATLGFLGVASLAFGLWSGLSGPRVADVELHDAVSNTLAASGFVATIQITEDRASATSPGSPAYSSNLVFGGTVVDYEEPDSEIVSSLAPFGHRTMRITEIGSSCWVTGVPSGPGVSLATDCSLDSIQTVLSSIEDLRATTDVALKGGVYALSPSDSRKFVAASYGSSGSNPVQYVGPARVEIRLNGGFIDWINLIVPGSIGALLRFTDVGTEPPIKRPPGPPLVLPAREPTPTATTAAPPTTATTSTLTTSTPTTLAG